LESHVKPPSTRSDEELLERLLLRRGEAAELGLVLLVARLRLGLRGGDARVDARHPRVPARLELLRARAQPLAAGGLLRSQLVSLGDERLLRVLAGLLDGVLGVRCLL